MDALVKASVPGAKVSINAEKPRKGCFEVRVNGAVVISLTDMARPFTKLKALDMDAVRTHRPCKAPASSAPAISCRRRRPPTACNRFKLQV
jgi:hypothetical protein